MEVKICSGLHSRLESLALAENTPNNIHGSNAKFYSSSENSCQEVEQITVLLKKGLMLTDHRKYEEAEALFTDIISSLEKFHPTSESAPYLCEAYNNLGLIQYKKVEFKKALASYEKSIQINPAFASAYYNQGTIYYRLGFYDAALDKMTKATTLQPFNTEFQNGFRATLKILQEHPWMRASK